MDPAIESQVWPWAAAGRARGGRPTQQDDLLCLHDDATHTQLLVLADGMGGHGAGELASAGVIEVARQLWHAGEWREQPGALFLERLCQEAHAELRRRGEGLARGEPHSTVVALLLKGGNAYWAHVGDSRLYRFQRGHLLGCTEDHSIVQARVRRGEIDADQAARDVDQHLLLRGLGSTRVPQVDHGWATLEQGYSFVLCSDGVWEYLSPAELARLAAGRYTSEVLHEALARVLERGGEAGDNAALILVRPARGDASGIGAGSWWRRLAERLRFFPRDRSIPRTEIQWRRT